PARLLALPTLANQGGVSVAHRHLSEGLDEQVGPLFRTEPAHPASYPGGLGKPQGCAPPIASQWRLRNATVPHHPTHPPPSPPALFTRLPLLAPATVLRAPAPPPPYTTLFRSSRPVCPASRPSPIKAE